MIDQFRKARPPTLGLAQSFSDKPTVGVTATRAHQRHAALDLYASGLQFLGERGKDPAPEEMTEVGLGCIVVTTISRPTGTSHGPPTRQLTAGNTATRLADPKPTGNPIETQGLFAEVKQRVDLAQQAVQPEGRSRPSPGLDHLPDGRRWR